MAVDKLEFDVLAHDRASGELSDIAGEFRKLSRDADSVGKTNGLSDLQKKLKAFSEDVDRQAPKNAAQLDKIAAAYKRLGSETDDTKRNAGLDALSKQLHKLRQEFEDEGEQSGKGFGASLKRYLTGSGGGKDVADAGARVGKNLGGSFKRWVTGSGGKDFKDAGEFGGTVFGSGLLGVLKTPVLGPALIATVGATVATVMPAVGAIAAGGLVAGFGAGIAALGIVFSAQSDVVGAAWSKTLTGMGEDMKDLSIPFDNTLVHIAGYAQRTFDNFKPALGKAFTNLAEPIDRFADDALHALDRFKPALDPIVTGTGQVLQALGGALPGMISNMAEGFTKLSQSVAANPSGLADTATGLGNIVRTATDGITTLNNLNGQFETLTGGTSAVDAVMGLLSGTIGVLFGGFSLLSKALEALGLKQKDYKAAVDITGQSQQLWTQGLNESQLAALGVSTTVAGTAGHVQTLDEKTQAAKNAAADYTNKLNDWITAMFKAQGLTISLAQAQIGVQQAIDDASKAVKDNGKATDIGTQKGRDNKNALIAVANAANTQTEAMNRSKVGVAKSAAAAESSKASFVRLAEKMGYSKQQANAMATAMIAIPNVTREAKLKANKADLETKLAAARKALADPKLTATKKAKLEAAIASLLGQVNTAQSKIDSLHGKTVGVTVKYSTSGVNLTNPSSVGRREAGGPVRKGEPYIVGEKRSELFVPDADGYIIPDPSKLGGAKGGTSAGAYSMASNGAAAPATIVFGSDGSQVGNALLWLLRQTVQKQYGGDVVMAFSGR